MSRSLKQRGTLQSVADAATLSATYAPGSVPSIITGTHTKGYDQKRNLYNLQPKHLRKTRSQLAAARAGLGLCKISILGDSTDAGETATPFGTNAPPVRFRNALKDVGYPVAGTGLVLNRNGASGNDSRWGASGTWTTYTQIFDYATTDGNTKTFTSDLPGTVVEVTYNSSNVGTFEVQIDGGAIDTVTIDGVPENKTWTKTGLANTTHTVVVRHKSSTLGILLSGVCVRATTGLLVSSYGVGGSKSAEWEANSGVGYANVAKTYGADLYILNVLTNDVTQAVTAATYKTNMQSIITRLVATGADLLLVSNVPRGDANSDTAHRIKLYELADENDLPLLDLGDRWGTHAIASTLGMMSDYAHPNAKGYAEKGQAYASVFIG